MTKLKEQRELLKLTQTDVAIRCNVSLYAYQLWERGAGKPKEQTRPTVIEVLQLPEDYFEED